MEQENPRKKEGVAKAKVAEIKSLKEDFAKELTPLYEYLDNFLGQFSPGEAGESPTLQPGSPIVTSELMYCKNRWKNTKAA